MRSAACAILVHCTETNIAADVILAYLIITSIASIAAEIVYIQGMENVPLVPRRHLNRR